MPWCCSELKPLYDLSDQPALVRATRTHALQRRTRPKAAAEQVAEHIVKLIVIFVLQTLVIPLLLLWALYGIARRAFEWPGQMSAGATKA